MQNFDFMHHPMQQHGVCLDMWKTFTSKFADIFLTKHNITIPSSQHCSQYFTAQAEIFSSQSYVYLSHSNTRKFHQLYQACVSHHSFYLGSWPLTSTPILQQNFNMVCCPRPSVPSLHLILLLTPYNIMSKQTNISRLLFIIASLYSSNVHDGSKLNSKNLVT